VLYCAQDREFATDLLDDFRKQSGLTVSPKFDTEAKKSVDLYLELVHEKEQPRCDVFWNNEILSMIRLQQQGLLQPYDSPSAKPYPESARAADHSWHAFATRARVLIVNTRLVPEKDRPRSLLDLTQERWRGQVVMAYPEYGTTRTQAACLFEVLGTEKAQDYYRALKRNKVQIAPGNKDVAVWVGQGRKRGGEPAAVGVTDTDDAMAEVEAGHPVQIIYPDQDAPAGSKLGTLFIPNTVGILAGCPNPDGARKLVDFLLSAEVEKRLAEGESHQAPLNPEVKAQLPEQLRAQQAVRSMKVDFDRAAELYPEVGDFLRKEFARPE
jgi:iron(III) transport system substrate-binding protein